MTKAKKFLALVLSVAMCLTMMVGCFTASAASGTITVGTTTIDVGTAPANVTITISGPNFAAGRFTVNYGTLPAPTVTSDKKVSSEAAGTGLVNVLVESGEQSVDNITTATVTLAFAGLDNLAIGDYAITVSNIDFADYDENPVEFAAAAGKITVKEAAPQGPTELALGFQYSLSLGNNIAITYTFRNKEGLSNSARVYAVCTKERYASDAEGDNMTQEIDCDLNPATGYYSFTYRGLAAKEMGKNVNVIIYGDDAQGNHLFVRNKVDTYSILTYATSSTGFGGSNTNLKKTLADMLNYGAAAQVNFNYNTSDLVNQRAEVKDYVTANMSSTDDLTFTDISSTSGDGFNAQKSLSLNSSIDFVATVNATRLAGMDLANVKAVFSYRNTKEQKDYDIEVYANDPVNASASGTTVNFYCRTLAAAQMKDKVTIRVYNGDTQISKDIVYSVESYCAGIAKTNANLYALCQSLMKYSNSAKVLLGY